ncbi:unnamed protein product, partial [Aureobasidium vineae]
HDYKPMGDFSVLAFNRLIRAQRKLDLYNRVRAGRRTRVLRAAVTRKRKRFLRCLASKEHNANTYISDVRLVKDKGKAAFKPNFFKLAGFREEVHKRGALKHIARESTKTRRAAVRNADANARTASALEALA